MRADPKLRAAVVLGIVLAWPAIRGALDGSIAVDAAAIRVAMALGLAYLGVAFVVKVVTGYLPEAEPRPAPAELPDGVEDAVIVEDAGA